MSGQARRDLWTGLVVLASTALVATALLWDRSFLEPRVAYVVDATDVTGIDAGSVVRLRGYAIGDVQRVVLLEGLPPRFEVHLGVRADVPIPRTTRATLAGGTLGGPGEVLLAPDTPDEAEALGAGAHIPGGPAATVADVLAEAKEDLVLLRRTLQTLDGTFGADAPGGGLAGLRDETRGAIADARQVLQQTTGTLGHLEAVAGAVGDDAGKTSEAARRAATEAETLLAADGPFQQLLVESKDDIDRIADAAAGYDKESDPEMRRLIDSLLSASCEMERFSSSFADRPWKTLRKGADATGARACPPPPPPPAPTPGESSPPAR